MFKRSFFALLIGAMLLASCASAAATPSPMYAPAAPMEEYRSDSAARNAVQTTGLDPQAAPQRMIIKNASLSIAVDDPDQSMQAISRMAEEMGGFVVSANAYQVTLANDVKVTRATVTIRVPVEKLDEALGRIKTETSQPVLREEITSQDVTAEYTDLRSRLTNAEAAELELRGFLDASTTMEETLNVYAQLKQVREEIEVLKGQIQYYEQSAAMSAVTVDLQANEAVQPITIGGWQPQGVARDAVQALVGALKALAEAGIWFGLFCAPLLLIAGVPLGLIILGVRKLRRKTRKTAPTLTTPAAQG